MQEGLSWIVYDQLHSALREADAQRFRELLRASPLEVWDLKDGKDCTCTRHSVFHNLSSCFFKEESLTEFSKILVDYCHAKYSKDASAAMKRTLKVREKQSSKTALMFAVQSNQKLSAT